MKDLADAAQFVRGIIAQLPFVVQNAVDGVQQIALDGHLFADVPEIGVFLVLLTRTQIDENIRHGNDETAQLCQFLQFDVGAIHLQTFQFGAQVVVVLCGKRFVEKKKLTHLLHAFQFGEYGVQVRHHGNSVHIVLPHGTEAASAQELAYGVKTYFLFKIIRVKHRFLMFYANSVAAVQSLTVTSI